MTAPSPRRGRSGRTSAPLGVAFSLLFAGCAGGRDVIPESKDERSAEPSAHAGAAGETYDYVARRTHGVVALAESRGLPQAAARALIDRLADALEGCASRLEAEGKLTVGAARVIAQFGEDGAVEGTNAKVAPGADVAANALLCLVTPIKLMAIPARDAAGPQRAMAIETTWAPGKKP